MSNDITFAERWCQWVDSKPFGDGSHVMYAEIQPGRRDGHVYVGEIAGQPFGMNAEHWERISEDPRYLAAIEASTPEEPPE